VLFNWSYLVILTISVALYYLVFKKKQVWYLNILSIAIITFWSIPSAVLLVTLTLLTHLTLKRSSRWLNYIGILVHLLAIFFLKTDLLWIGTEINTSAWSLLGLSYFSLQNISLLINNKKMTVSQLLLGNSFFSKFTSGPILTASDFLSLKPATTFQIENIATGTQRILFGLGKKLILADRLSVITNNIFEPSNHQNPGFSVVFGSMVFTLQMYLDFSAYSDIAIGSAKLFGIDFKENFKLPFRSKTVTEYWRKTHITLILWLTQHLYYPIVYTLRKNTLLGVSSAILVTLILSGAWHGNYLGYWIWGIINAGYLILEYLGRKKLGFTQKSRFGVLITFVLISASNFFFLSKTTSNINFNLVTLSNKNFLPSDWMVDFVAIIGNGGHFLQQYNLLETGILLVTFFSFESKLEQFSRQKKFSIKYLVAVIMMILFFGYFNAGDEFIYVQF
jgi:alginate O-acetyltransferase complex protein AlgI